MSLSVYSAIVSSAVPLVAIWTHFEVRRPLA